MKELAREQIRDFRLPSYYDIPNVGLYLEQVTKYISDFLRPLEGVTITGSMISNYVKKKLVSNPVKKQYTREQIAYLIFIALAKSVLSLENIQEFITLQKQTYNLPVAYEYFRSELENVLQYVFGMKDSLDKIGHDNNDTKTMLRNTIIAIGHKAYLETCFRLMKERDALSDQA